MEYGRRAFAAGILIVAAIEGIIGWVISILLGDVQKVVSSGEADPTRGIIGIVLMIAMAVLGTWFIMRHKEEIKNVAKPSTRETIPPDLDPQLSHIRGVLFYPKEVSWEKGDRVPAKHFPRYKAVIDTRSKKAYYMSKTLYDQIIIPRKIEWLTTTWMGEVAYERYLRKHGADEIIRKIVALEELLNNQS